ncbi:MAG: hypothetical protein MPEBLZ_02518 [Candidatus Methanoperedens nitroreducens]|uniref:EVE domain-containing protein n=1 Tax=Candidatus Methanoperedens nitratireducens TaxID=1392998 RepID=A0A0P8A429_9EURY|nr:hypothetical protein [Candidatus Methanoperedens sp. BLZ2]KAB2941664.1 MAG: hypothetical protein F9K14_18180 [Candidatus Methanoperedens sp.]KPQ42921.1 MAG: hypothetical protein MPEBLZ_02518 [Candidatus Methanoperedens sp. BLZ1]MBZ0175980.1 hypothetical protein [Candidatus Methanoperedens nitroreducens]MCX9079633.1 hypothetical protein [Candidatus Methanoperedens sp.]
MTNYWIIIARRKDQKLEDASDYIMDNNIWDFVSSNNDESRTPSNARKLHNGEKVLFYLSAKDREGKKLSEYPYPIFFARATLGSDFIDYDNDSGYEKFVRLNDIKIFPKPIEVNNPKKRYGIGATGPIMIAQIDKERYESACKKANVDP